MADIGTLDNTTQTTALATIERMTALQVFAPGAVDPLLDGIAAEVRRADIDVTTEKGRRAIASLAYKVARTKTFLDDMGKDLVAQWKVRSNAVDTERRKIRDRLDALRDEARKPLDDYEAANEKRIAAHKEVIAEIERASIFAVLNPSSDEIATRLASLREPDTRDWQEFAAKATSVRVATVALLRERHAAALATEAQAAELERLRAEAAERERQDAAEKQRQREAAIAAKAAEDARIAAELKAREEAEAAERAAEAERQRIALETAERERAAAAEREQLEAERLAAEERAAQAERDRAEAAGLNERKLAAAAEQAERDRVAAVEAERARVAEAQRVADAETARRLANKVHRTKINREALAALVTAGLADADGRKVVEAIARGEVPHVTIAY